MPREKKPRPTRRADGRYVCRYRSMYFYSSNPDDCLRQRDEFKRLEKQGRVMRYYVREFADEWFSRAYPVNNSTRKGLACHMRKLTDTIGDFPLEQVKPSHIKAVFSSYYVGMSESYIKAARQLYCNLFDAAVADGMILSNPAREKAARPQQKGKTGGHRAITEQERTWIETLCTDHRAYPVVMTLLYSGVRPQEAKAIDIDRDVDFKAETITVRQTAHNDPQNGQKYVFTAQGKTDRANRVIPLFPPLKQALTGKHGLLVTSAHGEPVTHTTWRVLWRSYVHAMETAINGVDRRWYGRTKEHKAIIAAGGKLPEWVPFTVVPYDLRHSFCTMCRSMRPPIELHTVIKWMGHADARMVLKVYDSVTDDRDAQEAERIKQAFRCQNGCQNENEQSVTVDL